MSWEAACNRCGAVGQMAPILDGWVLVMRDQMVHVTVDQMVIAVDAQPGGGLGHLFCPACWATLKDEMGTAGVAQLVSRQRLDPRDVDGFRCAR